MDHDKENYPTTDKTKKQKCIFFRFVLPLSLYIHPRGDQQTKKTFNISWIRVKMSYHRFNNFS